VTRRGGAAVAAVLAGAAAWAGLSSRDREPLRLAGGTMGTTYSVRIRDRLAPARLRDLAARIQTTLDALDRSLSTYRDDSDVCRFNRKTGTGWVEVSDATADVAAWAVEIGRRSGGAFDPTAFPLVDLWGFGPRRRTGFVPSEEDRKRARERVDFRRLEVRLAPPALRKLRPDVAIDFSGIAKGYAADAVSRLLDEAGVREHLVLVGGETRARGRPWTVAIESPGPGGPVAVLALSDRALSTSGGYRNGFTAEGRRHSHLMDPRTGETAGGGVACVSVLQDSAVAADGWATALAVLGPDEGFARAWREGVEARFVLREGDGYRVLETPGFRRCFRAAR